MMILLMMLLSILPTFTYAYQDIVTASVSTVGWRKEGLKRALSSIIDQVDHVNVFLQKYESIPEFLNNPKITIAKGEDFPEVLATGAGAKYFWADKVRGYHFTIDDDIIYPSNYVVYCIEKIEFYNRKAVVGFHGSIFHANITDYFESRNDFWFIKELAIDTPVHMLGTGTIAYHTDTIQLSMKNFPYHNMIDLSFAIAAQEQQIPLICLQREDNYLKTITELSLNPMSIYMQVANNHDQQTKISQKQRPWIIFKP